MATTTSPYRFDPKATTIGVEVELHLDGDTTFPKRYGARVKALGGRYSECRGYSHVRFVHLDGAEGFALAKELVADMLARDAANGITKRKCVVIWRFSGTGVGSGNDALVHEVKLAGFDASRERMEARCAQIVEAHAQHRLWVEEGEAREFHGKLVEIGSLVRGRASITTVDGGLALSWDRGWSGAVVLRPSWSTLCEAQTMIGGVAFTAELGAEGLSAMVTAAGVPA